MTNLSLAGAYADDMQICVPQFECNGERVYISNVNYCARDYVPMVVTEENGTLSISNDSSLVQSRMQNEYANVGLAMSCK